MRRLLRDLRELTRELASRHGADADDLGPLEVRLNLPMNPASDQDDLALARQILSNCEQQVTDHLKATSAYRQGTVYCFLCDSSSCGHATPRDLRDTFSGYRPTGKPEWRSFTNLCIERQEPRVDRLFGDSPEIIALVQGADELHGELMCGFGKGSRTYTVLGQVVAGLIPLSLDPREPHGDRAALTLQVVETSARVPGRLRLNILGLPLEHVVSAAADADGRGPAEALRRTIRTTRERLQSLDRRATTSERMEATDLAESVHHMLCQTRGDLERVFRPLKRRTRHAQERHEGGERPTSRALADAHRATDERFLHDVERQTIVVLGPRNRAHVFSPAGRHVTSLQLRPGEVERKTDRKRWRPMRRIDVAEFRRALSATDL